MIHVRRAGPLDASAMATLLNQIIAKGGTTAYVTPFSADDMRQKMSAPQSVWQLAEAEDGEVLGFQWFEPHPDLDDDSVSIASFVKIGATGLGVGSALFESSRRTAVNLGLAFLHAIIRADNESGLTYYQSRGFEDFRRLKDQELSDGTRVDKIWKRYDLRR